MGAPLTLPQITQEARTERRKRSETQSQLDIKIKQDAQLQERSKAGQRFT